MKEAFIIKRFANRSLDIIADANEIIDLWNDKEEQHADECDTLDTIIEGLE